MPSIRAQSRIICLLLGCLLPALSARAQNAAAKPYFDRGIQQYENGQYEEAIRSLTSALGADPNAYLAYYNRGLAEYRLANYDAAIADYTSTLLINHDYVNAVYGRAVAKYEKGDYDGAIADSNDAIHLNPSSGDAYYNRANAYYSKEEYAKASADYSETIRLNPSYANAYHGRGNSRKMSGDAQGALSDYEKAVDLDPGLQSQLAPYISDLRTQVSPPTASPSTGTTSPSTGTKEIIFGPPRTYEHKSGWFAMSIPENWNVTDKSSEDEVIVSFADPTENAIVVVRVYSQTSGFTQSQLGESLRTFVNERMGSSDGYTAGDLRPQKDGSIGLSFKYNQLLQGKNYQMFGDAFIEQHNGLVGVLALVMPQEQYDAKKKEAYDLLNSFRVTGVGK
jgi:tetratricopeptide (TPR) repeat protein